MEFISRKDWDSKFFSREIFACNFNYVIGNHEIDVLSRELRKIQKLHNPIVEARIRSEHFSNIPLLESIGFRFVDSRLEFRTKTYRRDFALKKLPPGLRWYRADDWIQIQDLTTSQLVDNPKFQSRYKNEKFYSRDDSVRYYLQWHSWVLENEYPLFCVSETNSLVSGFYSIVRVPSSSEIPDYKVALAAVRPESQNSGLQNLMQFWLFQNAPDVEWTTINSPALTNLPGLKNNIRAAKDLSHAEVFLYWGH